MSARAPEGVEVQLLDDTVDLEAIDFIVRGSLYPEIVQQLPALSRVSVVQVLSAGTDWVEPYLPPQATLCSARGARDAGVAEWIMAALLGVTSHVLRSAGMRTWVSSSLIDLESWRVLIVGMGSIGRRVEAHLAGFGTEVIGVASRARGDVRGVDELAELLPHADAVVVLAPLTDALVAETTTGRLRAVLDVTG